MKYSTTTSIFNPRFHSDWDIRNLYSLATWINGLAFRDFQFSETGKPVIKIAELKNGVSGQTNFTQQVFDPRHHITNHDMLFAWSGSPDTSIDVFWYRGQDGWLNQHIFKVEPNTECDRVFFYILLKYLKPLFIEIARNKQTTGLGHVTVKDLRAITVGLPPFPTQRRIADILGALDDKIECNRRINQTLEAMAQALYKHWFVDFGHFKNDNRYECETSQGVRRIPVSLKPMKFGELVDYVIGGDWGEEQATDDYTDSIQVIRGTDFPELASGGIGKCPIRFIKSSSKEKRQLQDGDLLIEISGGSTDQPTGRSLYISNSLIRQFEHPLIAASFCRLLRTNSPEEALVLYLHMRYIYELGNTVYYENQPIGIRNFQYTFFSETEELFVPKDRSVLESFYSKVRPLIDQMQCNESTHLIRTRDYLLPKLLSGEVEVKVAEDWTKWK